MRVAIIGTGGVGGYYGGLLANLNHDVTFVARGAHLEAMRREGLKVQSIHGDFTISPTQATQDPAEVGVVDLVLFCVKTYNTETSVQMIRPIIGANTVVISLQNGVDAAERIGSVIGYEHVIGGATWISSSIDAPGVIRQVSQFRRIVIGELNGRITPRLEAIFAALKETGATVEMTDNIMKVLWSKFMFISAASALGALTRLPVGAYRSVPQTRSMIIGLMREVEAVANAQSITLDQNVVEQSLAFMDNAGAQIKASMQLDVETGRQFELESMIGVIVRKGRESGLATPTAELIYSALLPILLKAQQPPA